jgi:hypothetical protein
MKKALSVTIGADNVLWLKGQAAATDKGSVSEVLDGLVTEARLKGRPAAMKSVAGTIDLPADDDLGWSGAYARAQFEHSLKRPVLVRERPAAAGRKPRRG